jgi:hypothetical protein
MIARLTRFHGKPQQLPLCLWHGVLGVHGGDQVFCP